MKTRTTISLTLFAALMLLQACGQKPSFTEDQSLARNGEGDAIAKDSGDPAATPPTGNESTVGDKPGHDETATDGGIPDDGSDDGSDDGALDGIDGSDGEDIPEARKITSEESFAAQVLGDASVTQDLDTAYLSTDLTMLRNYTQKNVERKQITRQQLIDTFDQGNTGAAETEAFDQVANRPLDLLVVIDNSGSMEQEQKNLATKLAPLLSYVADTDWQIGIVTTDPAQTCLRKLIKKGDANAAANFAAGINAGTAGSSNERGLLQAVRSLSGNCPSGGPAQPWIRSESTLGVLIVSDEDNCSDGQDCPGKDYASASYLTNYLASIREIGKNARVYGLIWHPSQNSAMCPTAANKANIYAQVIDATQGTWGSICDADYSATLSEISQNIMVSLNSKFTLRFAPDPGTVRVFLDTTEITTGFTVSGKVVDVNPPPADGTKVTIAYKYGAMPIKTRFNLRSLPMPDRLYVTVNGVLVPPTDYTVNLAVPSVDFAVPPPERAKVVVTYTKDEPLNKQFSVGDNIKPGSLTVKVNGNETMDYTVAEPVGAITFNTPPPESATLTFSYLAVGTPVLIYPLNTGYGKAKDLFAYDSNTYKQVGILTYNATSVTFNPLDYIEGRNVTLLYDNIARQRFEVQLSSVPVPGYTRATGGNTSCREGAGVTVVGMVAKVADCGFADDVMQVRVDFKYVAQVFQEFTFSGAIPAPGDFQEWHVFVNGIETTDYVRDGAKFTFAQPLPMGSTVKIQLIQEDK